MDINKEYELLEKLYFERIGGSEDELKACHIIQDELTSLGLTSTIEEFEVVKNEVHDVVLEVLEPYQKRYEAIAYSDCANTDGLECELCYFECDNDVLRKQVKNKIALVNGYMGMKIYKALTDSKALGFITYNGNIDMKENDLDPRELRKPLHEFGLLPGVNMRVEDAMEMVDKKATKVRIVTKQNVTTSMSHNLICELPGESDDVIVLTAHYDSVPYSKGAYDNGTGSVALYAIIKELKDKKLNHSLRFIWCGSEERGLLGSKAYVQAHENELEKIQLCINIDMIGNTMGSRHGVCTSEEALVHFLDYHAKMVGFPLSVKQGVY
ncbi:MAG: M28 family peptidase, partial [Traorella sp.]